MCSSKIRILSVVPLEPLVLVYLDKHLAIAVNNKEFYGDPGIKVGAGGGTITIDSIRTLARTKN